MKLSDNLKGNANRQEINAIILSLVALFGFYPYLKTNKGRFIYLKIDFRRAKAIIAHVYRDEIPHPMKFKLKNLSLLYVFNGHTEVTTYRPRKSYHTIETTHLYDTYNLRAYDDLGRRTDVRAGDPELVRILRYSEHAKRFDYMQFILNNYERFDRRAFMDE